MSRPSFSRTRLSWTALGPVLLWSLVEWMALNRRKHASPHESPRKTIAKI
jgi:hypothetical protein